MIVRSWLRAIMVLAVALVFAPGVFAQGNAPALSSRFLFIVDTSAPMQAHSADVLKVMNEVLASGVSGQIHPGDTIGLWTFDQDVHSDLPVQAWTAAEQSAIAVRTTDFLKVQLVDRTPHASAAPTKGRQFAKPVPAAKASKFDLVLLDLFNVIEASDTITVFMISTGDGQIKGTPFDAEINGLYQQNIKEMSGRRMPIVTVLQARKGKILRYTLNALPWPIVMPPPLMPLAAPPAAVAAAPKPIVPAPVPAPVVVNPAPVAALPAPMPESKPAPPVVVPPPVVTTPPPAVITPPAEVPKAIVPAESPVAAPALPREEPPVKIIAKEEPPKAMPPPPVETPQVIAPPRVVAEAPPKREMPAPAPVKAAAPVVVAPSPAPKSATVALENPPSLSAAPTREVSGANDSVIIMAQPRPRVLLFAGMVLAVVALVLIAMIYFRSRDTGPSLITRSMGNRKK